MPDNFETVEMLGEWPVKLPPYRVEHCRVQPNWEEGRLRSMHAHLKPGDVLYDVGAEHGDLSALYGTWVRGCSDPSCPCRDGDLCHYEEISLDEVRVLGRPVTAVVPMEKPEGWHPGGVVLVEGSDKFWPVIKATFDANGLTPLGCWAGFASDVDSDESLRGPGWADQMLTRPDRDGQWPSWADGDPEPHHGFKSVVESQETIPNIRFDTLAERCPPPDALTIDVEGAELLVLRGSERLLREVRPLVWVSIHPTLIAHDYPESGVMGTGDPDRERERIYEFMASLGYRGQHLESNHEEHAAFWPEERTDFDPWAGIEYLRP